MKNKRKLAIVGIFTAACLLLSYLESLLPSIFPFISFAKLGLSNVVILFTLVCFGLWEAILVMGFKCLIMGFIIGNPFMILYSLLGGLLALIAEWLLIKFGKNGIIAISSVGGIFHSLGQICMACILTGSSAAFVYLPHLAVFSAIAGLLTGFLVYILINRLPTNLIFGKNAN